MDIEVGQIYRSSHGHPWTSEYQNQLAVVMYTTREKVGVKWRHDGHEYSYRLYDFENGNFKIDESSRVEQILNNYDT